MTWKAFLIGPKAFKTRRPARNGNLSKFFSFHIFWLGPQRIKERVKKTFPMPAKRNTRKNSPKNLLANTSGSYLLSFP